jgi:hypothetical protein
VERWLITRTTADGERNASISVTGTFLIDEPEIVILDIKKHLTPVPPKGVKIENLVWLLQEKLTLLLFWGTTEFILPMESRNYVRFDRGIQSPHLDKWDGTLRVTASNVQNPNNYDRINFSPKYFTIILDLDKL